MTIRSIAFAVAASVTLPAAAHAATAFASSNVHVRAGPSTSDRIVDSLHSGERVEVDRCTRGYTWCHVSHPGPDGWVAARFLNDRRYGTRRPLDHFGLNLNIPQLGLHMGVGPNGAHIGPDRQARRGDRNGRNGRGRETARVCFYEDFNYGGRHFCKRPGQADRNIRGAWNDRISSIRVMGGASVRVCENYGFGGRCHVVTGDRSKLTGRNNDMISSYRVFGPGHRQGRAGGQRGRLARVCFYEDINYGGRSFCAHKGQADRRLSGFWNDRISSIRVMGDARVRVCENYGFGGRCHVVTRNRRQLGGRNNDMISSYRVM